MLAITWDSLTNVVGWPTRWTSATSNLLAVGWTKGRRETRTFQSKLFLSSCAAVGIWHVDVKKMQTLRRRNTADKRMRRNYETSKLDGIRIEKETTKLWRYVHSCRRQATQTYWIYFRSISYVSTATRLDCRLPSVFRRLLTTIAHRRRKCCHVRVIDGSPALFLFISVVSARERAESGSIMWAKIRAARRQTLD